MKFCFWGDIGDALRGTTIGGGELQISLLARSLALDKHEVIVIDPYIERSFVTPEGIKVLPVPNWNRGWPVLRMFWYRIPSIYKLFLKQNADFYYVRMRSILNLIAYRAAKKTKAKFLIALASDIDIMSFKNKFKFQYKDNFNLGKYLTQWLPGDLIFRYLIKRADYVIIQHNGQILNNKEVKGKVFLFPNIIDTNNFPRIDKGNGNYYIYVGSLTIMKGADLLFELVSGLNDLEMLIVVGQPNDDKAVAIFKELSLLKNTDLKGRKNHFEAMQYLSKAKALINTSRFEGFPNVFLEAWGMGIPVLSLKVDPGNIIEKNNLGKCFDGDLDKMITFLKAKNKPEFNGEAMKSYVDSHHDFQTAGRRFVLLLNGQK